MIEAIRILGEYEGAKRQVSKGDPTGTLQVLCENPASSDLYKHVISIELKKQGPEFLFIRVGYEGYSREKMLRYLYRRGPGANGMDLSPTSRITEPKKTLNTKLFSWSAQDFSDPVLELTSDDRSFLQSVCTCLNEHKVEIEEGVNEQFKPIKQAKESAILTITIEDDGHRYLGDYPSFCKVLTARALSGFYQKYNTESRSQDKICSVCREHADEVYGFVSTYAFYTVDKPGMVAGGFDQKNAWKNYPVCKSCALTLEEGKRWLDNYSLFKFYGFDYYLIPKPLRQGNGDEIFRRLEEYPRDIAEHKQSAEQRLTGKQMRLFNEAEDDCFDILAEQPNTFLFTILIFRKVNSEFKIQLSIEDVFPSRIRDLFDAKVKVDSCTDITSCEVPLDLYNPKKGTIPLQFTFGNIWYFFGKRKDEDTSQYFLDLINRIFTSQSVEESFVISGIIRRIRKIFAQRYSTKEASMRGLSLLLYLQYLGLLEKKREYTMDDSSVSSDTGTVPPSGQEQLAELIFSEFSEFFDSEAKKAVFLEGVLTQLLLNVQFHERDATPFRSKLQGLRLDQRTVQGLFPQIINKFEEYKKNYPKYRSLERVISKSMLKAGTDWGLSKDEISFVFVLGMNMASNFKTNQNEKTEEEEL